MTSEMLKKVQVLVESEEFGKVIEHIETAEELKDAFERHGIEITVDEVYEICSGIAAKKTNELDENDLDTVSGGFLTAVAVVAGTWAASYALGWVAGKIIKSRIRVCY